MPEPINDTLGEIKSSLKQSVIREFAHGDYNNGPVVLCKFTDKKGICSPASNPRGTEIEDPNITSVQAWYIWYTSMHVENDNLDSC